MILTSGYRFAAGAKLPQALSVRLDASASEGRSEEIRLERQAKNQ
jgi:hypothetical protein